ncbi:MAG TPA: hypothetical protein VMM78_08770 [Thermomicrobiales bacterium]|nr:hypothetical protein [Thermomicrobiales bacterium]
MEPETVACPSCGSKRTSEIAATRDKEGTIWCHSCGSVSESSTRFEGSVVADQVDEWLTLNR